MTKRDEAAAEVVVARQQWQEGQRRLEAEAGQPALYRDLVGQVEVLTDELRRRVGQTFTLSDLARAYGGADSWSRDALEAGSPEPESARWLPLVQDAAFHAYSRGATDYEP